MASVIVVDDDEGVRNLFQRILTREGHSVHTARTVAEMNDLLESYSIELVLLDVHLPDGRGDLVVADIVRRDPLLFVVMISGDMSIEMAVSATKNGAFHYLTKPFTPDTLNLIVQRALEARARALVKVATDRSQIRPVVAKHRLMGRSTSITDVNRLLERVARTPSTPVLITGESGTGKELVAQSIHELSDRADKPMVKVNCAAIPRSLIEAELFGHEKGAFTDARETRKGLFELADGGTIFLDEIGELDPTVQPKLLRVLEDRLVQRIGGEKPRPVNLRIVAATNRDLQAFCRQQLFREDLYFRLAVMTIHLPPLREHPDDIEILAKLFLEEKSAELGRRVTAFSPRVLDFFKSYNWPGNVRELRNMVERLIILADSQTIELSEDVIRRYCFYNTPGGLSTPLPTEGNRRSVETPPSRSAKVQTLEEMEKRHLMDALQRLHFNRTHAAQQLGISRSTLQRKISGYGLDGWIASEQAAHLNGMDAG